ncbi:hypothetical protein [Bifidobacterium sp. SO1]|uniref:hypothetical protein n=1 Tax=Bifidobacterium sp. SO1 TaxID=2809029 RepID=UPI001BDD3DBB|nr:hypothetical protein [Bifidobacterium sp. SO1]MBT1162167.1 hypothetical protein [Bifidobacterium sp. SO1]
MNRPDALSRAYAAILPQLKTLGYRPDLRSCNEYESARFMITVSRQPTTYVSPNGDWEREDGHIGNTPLELESLFMAEHYRDMLKHRDTNDLKGIAADILLDQGVILGSILSASMYRNGLNVEYRPRTGCPETVRITGLVKKHEKAINNIGKQLELNMDNGDMSAYQKQTIRRIMRIN